MKRRFGLLALVFFTSFAVFSQQAVPREDSILWDKSIRLKWSDFMSRPDTFSERTAGCAASIYVRGFIDNGLPDFIVTNSFIKNDAWTKDTASVNLLKHEQLHFDIAEMYARKIRKAIDSLRRNKVKDIEPYSEEIQKLLKMRKETDSLYDQQTAHGLYGNEQSVWNQKILKELECLSEYVYPKRI